MAGRRRKRGGDGGGHGADERWLLTYADMITLLLALFIALYAMSTLDATRFDALRRTLSETFRGQVFDQPGQILDGARDPLNPDAPSQNSARTVAQLQREASQTIGQGLVTKAQNLRKQLKSAGVSEKAVKVTTNERGIVIRLAGDTFFASGSAELRPGLRAALDVVGNKLRDEPRMMSVEGHTDGQPLSGGLFRSNQDLSQERAYSVWQVLREDGVPEAKMRTAGFAATKPLQIVSPPTAPSAKNRRVEIVILAPGASELPKAGLEDDVDPAIPSIGGSGRPAAPRASNAAPPSIVQPIVVISGY